MSWDDLGVVLITLGLLSFLIPIIILGSILVAVILYGSGGALFLRCWNWMIPKLILWLLIDCLGMLVGILGFILYGLFSSLKEKNGEDEKDE